MSHASHDEKPAIGEYCSLITRTCAHEGNLRHTALKKRSRTRPFRRAFPRHALLDVLLSVNFIFCPWQYIRGSPHGPRWGDLGEGAVGVATCGGASLGRAGGGRRRRCVQEACVAVRRFHVSVPAFVLKPPRTLKLAAVGLLKSNAAALQPKRRLS